MSLSHLIIFGIIALIVIPPEKLPEVAKQLAKIIMELKRSTAGVWDDLKYQASIKPEDFLKPEPTNTTETKKETTSPAETKTHE